MQINSHLSRLIYDVAAHYGDREALIYKNFGGKQWKSCSWRQFADIVAQVSRAMLRLGIGVQENIGVFSQNSVQYLFTDFGAWGIRAVTIPFYATSSEQQIQFMLNDAKIRFLFVGEQEQYDKARRVFATCSSLERIIVYDPAVVTTPDATDATAPDATIPGASAPGSADPATMSFADFLKLGEEESPTPNPARLKPPLRGEIWWGLYWRSANRRPRWTTSPTSSTPAARRATPRASSSPWVSTTPPSRPTTSACP